MSKIRDYIMSFTTTEEKLKALAEVNCRASLFEGMFSLEEINEIKTKKSIENSNETKSWFFEKINILTNI